jgi:hypothetical protein
VLLRRPAVFTLAVGWESVKVRVRERALLRVSRACAVARCAQQHARRHRLACAVASKSHADVRCCGRRRVAHHHRHHTGAAGLHQGHGACAGAGCGAVAGVWRAAQRR